MKQSERELVKERERGKKELRKKRQAAEKREKESEEGRWRRRGVMRQVDGEREREREGGARQVERASERERLKAPEINFATKNYRTRGKKYIDKPFPDLYAGAISMCSFACFPCFL